MEAMGPLLGGIPNIRSLRKRKGQVASKDLILVEEPQRAL